MSLLTLLHIKSKIITNFPDLVDESESLQFEIVQNIDSEIEKSIDTNLSEMSEQLNHCNHHLENVLDMMIDYNIKPTKKQLNFMEDLFMTFHTMKDSISVMNDTFNPNKS